MSTITMDGGAAAPALGALGRLKLARELAAIKTDLAAVAAGPTAALTRLKLVARANAIRVQLGGAMPAPAPAVVMPAAEPAQLAELREVIAGQHDALGLDALLSKIDAAARALHDVGALQGDAESLAHDAVSHWARLELNTNG